VIEHVGKLNKFVFVYDCHAQLDLTNYIVVPDVYQKIMGSSFETVYHSHQFHVLALAHF